jgi:hypothetical protein
MGASPGAFHASEDEEAGFTRRGHRVGTPRGDGDGRSLARVGIVQRIRVEDNGAALGTGEDSAAQRTATSEGSETRRQ